MDLDAAEIVDLFEKLGLASEAEREKARRLEGLGQLGIDSKSGLDRSSKDLPGNDNKGNDRPTELLFGGPPEHLVVALRGRRQMSNA